jgi:hypothetical protein
MIWWKRPQLWLWLAAICLLLLSAGRARADLKTLVMPGPVAQAHARFEMECERCHAPFSKGEQRPLCLACHKTVGADLEKKEGFHGRSPAVAATECKHCHTEHEGREADILLLDPETFDHQLTDFKREGAHQKAACEACHKPQEKKPAVTAPAAVAPPGFYTRVGKDCYACHGQQEPHNKELGQNCQDCHQAQTWKKVTYSHAKSAFKLNRMHKPVACVLCHPNQRWKKIAGDCFSCHQLDDRHAGRYGQKCQDCHSDKGPAEDPLKPKTAWKKVNFDHGKTKFVLQGKHQKLACDLCHPRQLFGQNLPTDCLSCHQKDDRHRGFYGRNCAQCHNPEGWKKSAFDHQKTKFPLEEKHKKVACSSCHIRPTDGEKLGNACINCHRLEDVHRSKETERCERCHSPAGWRESARFDHDLSRFPLLGLHAMVPCESCHLGADFKQVRMGCNDCHAGDDKHEQKLGPDCASCHTPNGWKLWQFDHNAKDGFKLEGAHQGLECLACHRTPVKKKVELARTCAACHRGADIHRGAFGRNCERCHLSESFTKLKKNAEL